MAFVHIGRQTSPLHTTAKVPGSKSITNRALLLAALAYTTTRLDGVLFADDTWQMMNALSSMGYALQINQAARHIHLTGRGRDIPKGDGRTLPCGNSGTTIRFLLAMLATSPAGGSYLLDGIPRMRERPIGELVDQLRALGARISYEAREGYPPVRVAAAGLHGGACTFSDAKSSQYISAVLMAGPCAENGVDVALVGAVTSEPYVVMTMRMMEQFGVQVAVHDMCAADRSRIVRVPAGGYKLPAAADGRYAIEPDASNASYFWAIGALVPGSRITVEGLGKGSLQGDVGVVDVLAEMGAGVVYGRDFVTVLAPANGARLRGVERDMNGIPDMVQTIAVAALFADGKTVLKNVWNLRVKETDRLAALEKELAKFGAKVQTGRDWISIDPPSAGDMVAGASEIVEIETYDDHRMAMAFSVAGMARGNVRILDPECVRKTYPNYFEDLQQMRGPGDAGQG